MFKVSKIHLPQSFGSVFEEAWSISPDAQHVIGTYLTTQGMGPGTSIYSAFIGTGIGTIEYSLPHVFPPADVLLYPFLPAPLTHVYSTFDFPGAPATSGRGINDNLDRVGYYRDGHGHTHGYVQWAGNSAPETFDIVNQLSGPIPLGGTIPNACFGINNAGAIVGVFTNTKGEELAYIALKGNQGASSKAIDWSFPAKGALDPLTGTFVKAGRSNARAINKHDDVIGTFADMSGRHGFFARKNSGPTLWDPPIKFDFDGAAETIGAGINDNLGVVGSYFDPDTIDAQGNNVKGTQHGYFGWLDNAGKFHGATQFDVPYSCSTRLDGIANDGTVVGSYTLCGSPRRYAFIASSVLWNPEVPHRLPNRWRLRPADSLRGNDVVTVLMIDELISRLPDSEVRDRLRRTVFDLANGEMRRLLDEPAMR